MIDIVKAVYDEKAKDIKRWPCKSNRASAIGYFVPELGGCRRRGVYERTHWQDKELIDVRLKLVFEEGNLQEKAVLNDLAAAGITLIEQQGAFEWKEYEITGHLDGVLLDGEKTIPVEIKSMSPNIFKLTNTFADFNNEKRPWLRAYMAQIMIYMLSKNHDRGIFILKNKTTGELKQIEVALDYDLAEACIKTAEAINKHIKENTLPDRIDNLERCAECPFKLLCMPDRDFGAPLTIADDPEFEKRIDRYLELKDAAKECDNLYKKLRDRAKATAGGDELNAMVGKYHLTGKKDAKGAFRLKIEGLD